VRSYLGRVLIAKITVANEELLLHPLRALHWPRMGWLVLSDLHLGKAAHLRKGGAAIPEGHDERTLQRLSTVVEVFRPQRIVILGDLFHSSVNAAWDRFAEWAGQQSAPIHLVPGNHDILAQRRYADAGVQVCDESIEEGPFVLTHDAKLRPGAYVIGGHVHPGIQLSGKGRQRLRLPCFWFGERMGLFPAFGMGTGLHVVEPGTRDRVLACTDRAVIDVSPFRQGSAQRPALK
jgi:DNA ligase-associated metallophosphoesterase